jgi:hypothetical protein
MERQACVLLCNKRDACALRVVSVASAVQDEHKAVCSRLPGFLALLSKAHTLWCELPQRWLVVVGSLAFVEPSPPCHHATP